MEPTEACFICRLATCSWFCDVLLGILKKLQSTRERETDRENEGDREGENDTHTDRDGEGE